ncbi:ATP synthase F1, epsilon subunit [Ruegeria lacuscaerulensis ITI-1157]|nr:ATP synthase F1, epsilon subunit [Ruegeria lacuscaerulensis ITI-1157]SHK12149.1 F-type H+-transporting ATPase subunit epsilon [Ruegeria lacuscaerulensis ITI-1157]
MTMARNMHVALRLPTRTLYEGTATALTAVAPNGSFGILPNHVDFVTALVPSVLTLKTPEGHECFFGIDEGMLVKKGPDVSVAIRRGAQGDDLDSLRATVEGTFLKMDEDERMARAALSGLEANLVRRFAEFRKNAP